MPPSELTNPTVSEIAPFDPGTLRRAIELALAEISKTGRRVIYQPHALSFTSLSSIVKIAEDISTATSIVTRVRTLGTDDLGSALASNCTIVAQVGTGWLVIGRRTCVLVTVDGESRFSKKLKKIHRLIGKSPQHCILLEPQIGLDPLSKHQIGSSSPWLRLQALMALESREILSLIVYALVLGGLSLAVPVAVQVLVNSIAFGSLLQPLVVLSILLFGVLAFSGIIRVVESYAVEVLQRRIFVRVAEDFARRLTNLSAKVHDHIDARELANRFFEVVGLQKSIGRLLLDGLSLTLQTFVGMLLLAFYHPLLLAFDVALLVGLGIVFTLGHGAVKTSIQESNAKYQVAGWLEAIGNNPRLFQRQQAAMFAATKADSLIRTYLNARRHHYRKVLRQMIGGVGLRVVAMVALLGLGGWLVMERELTLGQLVAAELVVGVVASGFAKIGKHFEAGYDLLTSLDKVGKVLDLSNKNLVPAPALETATNLPAVGLEISQLQFSRGSHPATTIPQLLVSESSRLWLQGRSGSGKSTLLETIAGIRSPDAGTIQIFHHARNSQGNGHHVHDQFSSQQSYLLRPDDLVAGTILDNLRVGDAHLEENDAWDILAEVELDGVVSRLKHGINTEVLLNGSPLSGTEIARLSIARAMIARPRLLLIDGALDYLGLDPNAREKLLTSILGPDAPRTIIVVSSDPEVQKYCNHKFSLDAETTS